MSHSHLLEPCLESPSAIARTGCPASDLPFRVMTTKHHISGPAGEEQALRFALSVQAKTLSELCCLWISLMLIN